MSQMPGGWCWVVHYKGQLVHKDPIKFRFWGMGDDVLLVRVNGEVVLSACWPDENGWGANAIGGTWQSDSPDSRMYYMGHNLADVGDWVTLEAGVPQDIEILIGEVPGGHFVAMLAVEVDGVEYEKGPQGNPILPMFKTAEPSLDLIETIHGNLVVGEVCVTNGPVFCDYDMQARAVTVEEESLPILEDGVPEDKMRMWTLLDGKTMEAEFVVVVGDKVLLKNSRGRQKKIPLAKFSRDDRTFIELALPPEFKIDFSKQSKQVVFVESTELSGFLPEQLDYVFTAKLKQSSAGVYNHELKVEYFAIGDEVEGDNFILLDRQESYFTPTKENARSYSFSGPVIPLRETVIFVERRGQKYGGYLVVVTDSRGEIVDYGTSNEWLYDLLGTLRTFPLGKHFNKKGMRVEPPRPDRIGVY